MGIKLTGWNKAGTGQCFMVEHYVNHKTMSVHRLEKPALFQVGNTRMGAAYVPYTGHWDLFDLRTGERVATMNKDYFEMAFIPLKIADLIPGCEDDAPATG